MSAVRENAIAALEKHCFSNNIHNREVCNGCDVGRRVPHRKGCEVDEALTALRAEDAAEREACDAAVKADRAALCEWLADNQEIWQQGSTDELCWAIEAGRHRGTT